MIRQTFLALLLIAPASFAQHTQTTPPKPTLRELTLQSIYDPKDRVAFAGTPQSGFVWLDDKTVTWPRTNERNEVVEQVVLDTETGTRRTLFDATRLEALTAKIAGVSAEDARRMPLQKSWTFSPDKRSVILPVAGDLYVYTFATNALTRVTSTSGEEEEPSFSPDGKSIAFIRDHNLFVAEIGTSRERQLTTDGSDDIYNGILDWVYQEEIYGRGLFKAYWWSPDSTRIAYLRLDEKSVPRFTVVDHIPYRQKLEVTSYPKSGDPNPSAKLFTVSASGGPASELPVSGSDMLIVNVDWTPDSRRVVYQVQDREQTMLTLSTANADASEPRQLLVEKTQAWVERGENPVWLSDGSFLWLSERSGFKHIYHYSATGTLLHQVTTGRWEARTLHGIDKANQWVYFSGTERSVTGTDVYRIRIDGSRMTRLSEAAGQHNATFNGPLTSWVDSWTTIERPIQISLYRADGTRVRVVDDNPPATLGQYRLSKPEFMQVKTRDGFPMEALMIRPPDFDPAKKYPVYQHTYSGPHAQQVRNAWKGSEFLWWQLLAQRGVIVFVVDNRSASGKGIESAWPIYKNLGVLELRDLEDGVQWLKSQPYVDPSRILLNGWSYGGFMTSYALTHSSSWKAGIAGGSVVDWRDYDSVYTERYMLTPEHNKEGSERTSPRLAAENLKAKLLLLHGTIDDNVHMQNTIQFAYELQKAGKAFRMMVYPKSRHGITDYALLSHMRATMLEFVEENLLR
jgi:dipeptidyl-peptidase-4